MVEPNENIDRTIELSRHLLYCADFGNATCYDRSCRDFYRTVRERANRTINEAEQERRNQMNRDFPKTGNDQGNANEGLKAATWRLWQSAKKYL
jgi:hypothetical protein